MLEIGEAVDQAISILMHKTTFTLRDIRREVKSLYDRKHQGEVPAVVEHDGERLSLENFIRAKLREHPGIDYT